MPLGKDGHGRIWAGFRPTAQKSLSLGVYCVLRMFPESPRVVLGPDGMVI